MARTGKRWVVAGAVVCAVVAVAALGPRVPRAATLSTAGIGPDIDAYLRERESALSGFLRRHAGD